MLLQGNIKKNERGFKEFTRIIADWEVKDTELINIVYGDNLTIFISKLLNYLF